jgi:hypothetical protein
MRRMSETINLELLEAARYDSTLGYVIKKGLPLNRRVDVESPVQVDHLRHHRFALERRDLRLVALAGK